jgi:hypothetical protein
VTAGTPRTWCRVRSALFRLGPLAVRVLQLPPPYTAVPIDAMEFDGDTVWTGRALLAGTWAWDPGTGRWSPIPDPPGLTSRDGRAVYLRLWAGSGLYAVPLTSPPRVTAWLAG